MTTMGETGMYVNAVPLYNAETNLLLALSKLKKLSEKIVAIEKYDDLKDSRELQLTNELDNDVVSLTEDLKVLNEKIINTRTKYAEIDSDFARFSSLKLITAEDLDFSAIYLNSEDAKNEINATTISHPEYWGKAGTALFVDPKTGLISEMQTNGKLVSMGYMHVDDFEENNVSLGVEPVVDNDASSTDTGAVEEVGNFVASASILHNSSSPSNGARIKNKSVGSVSNREDAIVDYVSTEKRGNNSNERSDVTEENVGSLVDNSSTDTESKESIVQTYPSGNSYTSTDLFTVTYDNKTYDLSAEEIDLLIAIVAAESDKTADDALAVISVILNRCESPRWIASYGTDPIRHATAPNQFVVYQHGSYKKYLNGNAPDTVKRAVLDALGGVRNNDFLSFRSNGSRSYSNNMITSTGNRYK